MSIILTNLSLAHPIFGDMLKEEFEALADTMQAFEDYAVAADSLRANGRDVLDLPVPEHLLNAWPDMTKQ